MHMLKLLNWQYRHFNKKRWGVRKMIADLEFKRYKIREMREELRRTYDDLNARFHLLDEKIKKEKEAPAAKQKESARLDDQKILLQRDIDRMKEQMDGLDREVAGSKATNEYPEGVAGINQQLESLRELDLMIRDYMKNL